MEGQGPTEMQRVALRQKDPETCTARAVQGQGGEAHGELKRRHQSRRDPDPRESEREGEDARNRARRGAPGPAPPRASRPPLPPGPYVAPAPGPPPGPPTRPLPLRPGRHSTLWKAKSSCLSFSRCGSAPCRRNRNFIILRPAAGAAPAAATRRMRRAAPPVLRCGRGARRPGRGRAGRDLHGVGGGSRDKKDVQLGQ